MRLLKKISIPFLTALFLSAGLSCSMDRQNPDLNNKEDYVTAHLTIGGTVYYDEDGAEPQAVEGLKVRIIGTSGTTATNQHGYFIINTTKTVNRGNVDEYIMIEVSDIDDSDGGGLFATKTTDLNIGKLLEWDSVTGGFVARNDASKLNIYVEKAAE